MRVGSKRWAALHRGASANPLTDDVLGAIRATVVDEASAYFSDGTRSPRTERAVQIELLRLLSKAEPSTQRDANLEHAARLRTALLAAPSSSHSDDAQARLLDAFTSLHLPQAPVRLRRFEQTGRGLMATRDVGRGEAALRIPERLLLTAEVARSHATVGPALADATADAGALAGDVALAVALLVAPILAPGGAWAEYVALLPERPPGALHWTAAQRARLSATPLPDEVRDVRSALREIHGRLAPALARALPEAPEGTFGWRRFLWAYAMVESRGLCLTLRPDEPPTTCLVPAADMCNHAASAQLAWPEVEEDAAGGRSLVFRALVDVSSGAELLLYYGRLSCLQQLQFYGFIAAEQLSREVIAVDLEMPDEAVAVASLEEAAAAAEAQAALRVGLMRRHGLGLRHFLRDAPALPPALVGAVRVCVLDGDELRAIDAAGDAAPDPTAAPLSEAAEARAVEALRGVVASLDDAFAAAGGAEAAADEADDEAEGEGDAEVDGAIDAYLDHQRRVLASAHRALDALEAGGAKRRRTTVDD